MQIIDNFFPEDKFQEFQSLILGPRMPWYYIPNISVPDWLVVEDPLAVETDALQCLLYDKHRNYVSEEYTALEEYFYNMIIKLGYTKDNLMRIRATMKWPKPGLDPNTYNVPHIDSPRSNKTIVFYLNDSDGDTRLFHQIQTPIESPPLQTDATKEQIDAYAAQFIRSGFTVEHCVTPKANRLLMFDGMQYHTAGHPFNVDRRVILNINLEEV
jgi:hypothetical protein